MSVGGRRRFLQLTVGGAVGGLGWRAAAATTGGGDNLPDGKMPMRALGRTGVQVSLVGLGGFHLGLAPDQQAATRLVRAAIDHGINFMDNCWDYNDGKSHVWMGRALGDGYRKRVF